MMMMQILDTPEKMAQYSTDNGHLQAFYVQLLQIKEEEARKAFSEIFWSEVDMLPLNEKTAIKAAQSQIAQRLYSRMGSILVDLKKFEPQQELMLQD
jgi:hypothetical protein